MAIPQDQPKPHIPIQKMNIERPRYKPQRPIRKPERDSIQHGAELSESVEILQRTFAETSEIQPPEFNPALIFRLQLDGYVEEDDWRKSGLTLLSKEKHLLDSLLYSKVVYMREQR